MRCVIDLQGAQSESRFRGIGRYCLNLALAMARQTQEHELLLALNATWPERAVAIRSAVSGVLQQDHIVTFNVPSPCAQLDPRNDWRARVSEKVRERFLEELNPDVVYVLSLFEGLGNNSVTSIDSFARNLPTAAVLYDLIPLLRPEEYLPDARRAEWYNRKLGSFRKADLLTAISESSRQEAVQHAQIPADSIVNIGCGVDTLFRPLNLGNIRRAELRRRYRITGSFFMYSGAVDSHKNLDGLIAAFALLPGALRKSHQLVIVGAHDSSERERLLKQIQALSLRRNSVVFTGYVPDEDLIALYNECALFVLPSFHEGFGLPAAEAMACGAPTIGANATSIPEVIGRNDALFDPREPSAIARKINEVMTDDDFRRDLINHGLLQSQQFTWERSAQRAWRALEELHNRRSGQRSEGLCAGDAAIGFRPLLAYFSPLPPVPSGIADYSAELLPELARHYEIEIVIFQPQVTDDRIRSNFAIRSLSYFEANSARYSRIIYHMGNSPFHTHMWRMMERYPGTVVLHDFYQSNLLNWVEREVGVPDTFGRALYNSHGYSGLLRDVREGREAAMRLFPCNRHVLDAAAGVIVHSRHSIALAEQWYGPKAARDWTMIPQPRKTECPDRGLSRARLGFADGDYVVCSFGMIGDTKLNHRLLSAWVQSALASEPNCKLVFVGEMHGGEYGRQLRQEIQSKRLSRQVFITGLADAQMYCDYLAAADQAVQLRTSSRGETSRAVLDCLAYGLPTIVNAHGSLCDLPADTVLTVPDEFGDGELAAALEALHVSPDSRRNFSLRGTALIRAHHDPSSVAAQYRRAIEGFAQKHRRAREEDLLNEIGNLGSAVLPGQRDLIKTAYAVANNRIFCGQRQLLMDVSATAKDDLKTGIERVARAIVMKSIEDPPAGFRVEPVRGADSRYLYARTITLKMLASNVEIAETPVEVHPGDIYLGLDWSSEAICSSREFFAEMQAQGIKICFLVYDLLPILLPHRFPPGTEQLYRSWLEAVVAIADTLIAISKSTADDLITWLDRNRPERLLPLQISYWPLGSDIEASSPSKGLPADAGRILRAMQSRPSFLMVGTMEPRKGHAQVLSALDQLWVAGVDINLVIVGKQGWMMEALAQRIQQHRESGNRLFWLAGISDEMLLRTYENASALIAASEGEGFGLPLIEAARAKIPVIARDLPVFREVAGDHAFYFSGDTPDAFSSALRQWLALLSQDAVPRSEDLQWANWEQSAAELMNIVLGDTCYREWPASERQSDAAAPVSSSQAGGGSRGLKDEASRAANQEHPV